MSVFDAHVHVWRPSALPYPWLASMPALDRELGPADIDDAGGEITEWVFVEADSAAPREEAEWVAALDWPGLRGIVAKADLRDLRLDEIAATRGVVGVRHLLQDQPITDDLVPGLRAVGESGLTFDACVRRQQLPALADLLAEAPGTRAVLDHVGKPAVAMGLASAEGREWAAGIRRIAELPHVFVKLSGLPAEGGLGPDFLRVALEAFGPERCMFGGDWPVSGVPGAGVPVRDALDTVRAVVGAEGADRVFGDVARTFYGLTARVDLR